MALITPKKQIETKKIKLEITNETFLEIEKYCSWVGIDDLNHFFEEAAKLVLLKDKDWKSHQSSSCN